MSHNEFSIIEDFDNNTFKIRYLKKSLDGFWEYKYVLLNKLSEIKKETIEEMLVALGFERIKLEQ